MNYLMFNNGILLSDGDSVRRIDNGNELKRILKSGDAVRLCVVDVDVLVAAAVEDPVEKKDSSLVRKFTKAYQPEVYVIQDERIDHNLFQVIGVKEQKVREVYASIPSKRVESFIPYGIALRNTLISHNIDFNRTVVFVDDSGDERLLTVFDGLKFSRTRVIANDGEDILPEIKRSQIDFYKKNQEYAAKDGGELLIVVNDQELAAEFSKNNEGLSVQYLNVAYPALEGLKIVNTPIKFVLPEEIIKRRKEAEFKNNVITAVLSLSVAALGLVFFLFYKFESRAAGQRYGLLKAENSQLYGQLRLIDKEAYREDLKRNKSLNYGLTYLKILDLVPASYEISSFKFERSNQWSIAASLTPDEEGPFEQIPRTGILKNAEIKDCFVNNRPGKYLRITI